MKKGKKAGDNPWDSNGLEWACPSPPPHGNFAEVPVVHRGPYEYSHPDREEDFWPQDAPIDLGNNAPSANPENEYGE